MHVAAGPIPTITQRGWAIGRWGARSGHIGQGGLLEVIIAGAPTERKSILGTNVEPCPVRKAGSVASIWVEDGEGRDGGDLIHDVKPASGCLRETFGVAVPTRGTEFVGVIGQTCGVKGVHPWRGGQVHHGGPRGFIGRDFNQQRIECARSSDAECKGVGALDLVALSGSI